jgi:hypothetical protein
MVSWLSQKYADPGSGYTSLDYAQFLRVMCMGGGSGGGGGPAAADESGPKRMGKSAFIQSQSVSSLSAPQRVVAQRALGWGRDESTSNVSSVVHRLQHESVIIPTGRSSLATARGASAAAAAAAAASPSQSPLSSSSMMPASTGIITNNWKTIRQTLRRVDPDSTGGVPLPEFGSVLAQFGISLSDADLDTIARLYGGKGRSKGLVRYDPFLRRCLEEKRGVVSVSVTE